MAATLDLAWTLADVGATYRLVRLVTRDRIAEPFRQALKRRSMILFDWASCPHCVSVWVAAGVVALTYTVPRYWWYVALGLALSAVAGVVSELVP